MDPAHGFSVLLVVPKSIAAGAHSASVVPKARSGEYWGTQHRGRPATVGRFGNGLLQQRLGTRV